MNRRAVGAAYEAAAAAYLEKLGYRILERNFRCARGEIDLIAEKDGYLVFIEVKYRKNSGAGYPEEAVDERKRQALGRAARAYLAKNGLLEKPCRFDVVSVSGDRVRVIENAFWL